MNEAEGQAPQRLRRAGVPVWGEVLNRSLGVWVRNLVPFTLLALLLYAPIEVANYYEVGVDHDNEVARQSGPLAPRRDTTVLMVATTAGEQLIRALLTAAVIFGTFEQLRGRHADLRSCVTNGLQSALQVVGVTLAQIAMLGAVFVIPFLAMQSSPELGAALMLPALVYAVMLSCRWFVVIPVAVIERTGIADAFRRSGILTTKFRWGIFMMMLLLYVLPSMAVLAIGIFTATDSLDRSHFFFQFFWLPLMSVLIFAPLGAVLGGVTYHELRRMKEGVDVEELATVFS